MNVCIKNKSRIYLYLKKYYKLFLFFVLLNLDLMHIFLFLYFNLLTFYLRKFYLIFQLFYNIFVFKWINIHKFCSILQFCWD